MDIKDNENAFLSIYNNGTAQTTIRLEKNAMQLILSFTVFLGLLIGMISA